MTASLILQTHYKVPAKNTFESYHRGDLIVKGQERSLARAFGLSDWKKIRRFGARSLLRPRQWPKKGNVCLLVL